MTTSPALRFTGLLFVISSLARAATGSDTALLREAAGRWLGERDRWAFFIEAREVADDGQAKSLRRERYDPSLPPDQRREFLSVDGQPPTEAQLAEWRKHHAPKKPKEDVTLGDLFDFKHARVLFETPKVVGYDLPLRRTWWLVFPEKIELSVIVGKTNHAVEQVRATIREPFHFALGLGRVMAVDIDMRMHPPQDGAAAGDPGKAQPEGTVKFVLSALGKRTEYACREFHRVTPFAHLPESMAPTFSGATGGANSRR